MNLFKDIVIIEKLRDFTLPNFEEKMAIIKKWHDYYHSGTLKTDKEKEVAPDYTAEIFIDLLGYSGKTATQTTFTSEYTIGSKFPDGVLGLLNRPDQDDIINAVLELKGAMIPLDQPQKREKNYTPIEQGFGYKRLLRNCPFVIVSNFYEVRLYNDNEIDYEVWTLDDLINPDNDYFSFRKFYYLLCAKNLVSERGKSRTESLMSDIRLEEESITNKFYADYKERRLLLMRNLYWKNEVLRNNPDLLIEMGQKLIDRVIFMCFAEDRGLLPADILQTIKRDFQKSSMVASVWDSLKIAFNYVNKGNQNWGIPDGYNGGLFARDDGFDDLIVEDHVLAKIIDFGMYDFADQLSVTILGHIFEQSISDLEEIKEKIEDLGKEKSDTVEKKTSKRKKDGIFYTPEYIVDYIVKNSLGAYLREHETKLIEQENLHDELGEKEYEKRQQAVYTKYQEFLSQVKVLDPACGSGAFLVRVFDYLLEENRRVGKILGGLFSADEIYKDILQNNIYGVDLNAESVEITKLSLWLKSAQKGKKLSNLDNNIKCGNSLIDDPAVAGEKAFKWEEEFKSILDNGGFDVIVGNPPYVFLRSGNMNTTEKRFYKDKYTLYNLKPRTDIYFYEKSFSLLRSNGFISFIAPNNILTVGSLSEFREEILTNFGSISFVNIHDKIFQDANVDTMISIFQNKVDNDILNVYELENSIFKLVISVDKNVFLKGDNIINYGLYKNPKSAALLEKIENSSVHLGSIISISNGLVAYKKNKGLPYQDSEMIKKRIYHSYNKKDKDWKEYVGGSDLHRWSYNWSGEYLKYGKNLGEPRTDELFNKDHLLVRVIPSKPPYSINCNLINAEIYNDQNYIVLFNEIDIKMKYIISILNSRLISFWFINKLGKMQRGLFPQLKAGELKKFPIKSISVQDQKPFIEKADIMLDLNKKFHEQSSRFVQRMVDNYGLEKASKKIEKFWELDFSEFVSEMRKKGANIPLSTQDELQDYFEKKKSELLELDGQIKKTDNEIDTMVYALYGLNDEEIQIIENS